MYDRSEFEEPKKELESYRKTDVQISYCYSNELSKIVFYNNLTKKTVNKNTNRQNKHEK